MAELVNLKIDEALIHKVLEEKIAEAIGVTIVDKERVLDAMIQKMMNMRVDEKGQPSSYSSAKSYVQWASEDVMRQAVKKALDKVFAAQQERIEALIERQLKASSNKLAKALVYGLEQSLKSSWNTKVEFRFEEPKKGEW